MESEKFERCVQMKCKHTQLGGCSLIIKVLCKHRGQICSPKATLWIPGHSCTYFVFLILYQNLEELIQNDRQKTHDCMNLFHIQ